MRLYWCYRGGQDGPPYVIEVVRALCHAEACEAFAVAPQAPCVHELASPKLVAECAGLTPLHVICKSVRRLPSAYDQFRLGPGQWDFEAMQDAGFDVS